MWSQTYGGTSADQADSLVETSDGGYTIACTTQSFGAGLADFWLIKTDAAGNMQWNRTYGGPNADYASALVATSDGGYTIAGNIIAPGFPSQPKGACLIKTDEFGEVEWNQTYDDGYKNYAYSLVETDDGGYTLAGTTNDDFWLLRTNEIGDIEWSREYGGTEYDSAYSLVATSDGGYALAGTTRSFGNGGYQAWLVKTDASGNEEWNRIYGGIGSEGGYSLTETSDGGYAIIGYTDSFGAGKSDFWLIKTDASGNMKWNRTYGGTGDDRGTSLVETGDGGYIIVGDYNLSGSLEEDAVSLLVKTDKYGNMEGNQTYEGAISELVATVDGGYALAGYMGSLGAGNGDALLVKTADEYTIFPHLRPPEVCIEAPKNRTYNTDNVSMNFTVDEETTWMGYSLDGQGNVTVTGNTTLTGLANGSHRLTLYANDTDGNIGVSEEVFFTVDINAPVVSVLEPKNITYNVDEVWLNFTVNEAYSEIVYCLDGQANVTIIGNTKLTGLTNGSHNITVYATNAVGNTGKSETVTFTIAAEQPPEDSNIDGTAIALAVVATVVVGISSAYYVKRRKQQTRA